MNEGRTIRALAEALKAAAKVLEREANRMEIGTEDPLTDWLAEQVKGQFVARPTLWKRWPDKSIGRNHFYQRVERMLGKPIARKGVRGWIL